MSMLAEAKVSQILTINDDNILDNIGLETVFTGPPLYFSSFSSAIQKHFFSIHNNDLWHRKIQDDIKPGNQNPPSTLLCCEKSNRQAVHLGGREEGEEEDVL